MKREAIQHFNTEEYVYPIKRNELVFKIRVAKKDISKCVLIEIIEKARELTRYLRKRTDISFRIGIGEPKEFLMASESYTEALNALVVTTGSVAHVDDLPIRCEYGGNYPVKAAKRPREWRDCTC